MGFHWHFRSPGIHERRRELFSSLWLFGQFVHCIRHPELGQCPQPHQLHQRHESSGYTEELDAVSGAAPTVRVLFCPGGNDPCYLLQW